MIAKKSQLFSLKLRFFFTVYSLTHKSPYFTYWI